MVSIMGVVAITTLCDLGVIVYSSDHKHETVGENHHDSEHHHGEHNDNHKKWISVEGDHNSSENDECCDDAAALFASALYSSIVKYDAPIAKYFLVGLIEYKPYTNYNYVSESVVYHEYDDPPPIKGFQVRVQIQSFLN